MPQMAADQISRLDMADFFDQIYNAKNSVPRGETPITEVSRKIIDHFNRGEALKGFERVGYFIYDGVVVCELGKGKEIAMRDWGGVESAR